MAIIFDSPGIVHSLCWTGIECRERWTISWPADDSQKGSDGELIKIGLVLALALFNHPCELLLTSSIMCTYKILGSPLLRQIRHEVLLS